MPRLCRAHPPRHPEQREQRHDKGPPPLSPPWRADQGRHPLSYCTPAAPPPFPPPLPNLGLAGNPHGAGPGLWSIFDLELCAAKCVFAFLFAPSGVCVRGPARELGGRAAFFLTRTTPRLTARLKLQCAVRWTCVLSQTGTFVA